MQRLLTLFLILVSTISDYKNLEDEDFHLQNTENKCFCTKMGYIISVVTIAITTVITFSTISTFSFCKKSYDPLKTFQPASSYQLNVVFSIPYINFEEVKSCLIFGYNIYRK